MWHRYATAAVAMEQMTWPMVLSHANQMFSLAEEERISGTGPALVFVYDELLRKSIATRAEWGDPSLDQTAPNRLFEAADPAEPKQPRKASQAAKELAKQQAQLETSMAAMSKDKEQRRRQKQWQGTHQQAEEDRAVLRQAKAEHREEKVGEKPPL